MVDQELLDSFIAETHDLLDEVEPQLIELSHSGNTAAVDSATLNTIFRLFHSMKGSAGFLGLSCIGAVTHIAETLLDLYRTGQATLQLSHTETLCQTIDFFRELLQAIERSGTDSGYDQQASAISAELQQIIASITGGGGAAPAATAAPPLVIELDAPALPNEMVITPAMRQSFGQETEELLDQAEQALLGLESAAAATWQDQLTAGFRALHTIKGISGYMGLVDMERVAHRMENVLDKLRGSGGPLSSADASVLLGVIDVLRDASNSVAETGSGEIANCAAYLDLLSEISDEEANRAAPAPVAPAPAAPAAPAVVPAARSVAAVPANRSRQDVRVDIAKLDALVNLVGELVIAVAVVTGHPHVEGAEIESLDKAVHLLQRVSRDLQDVAMSARMVPLAGTFRKMIRLVHDLANKSGKQIDLEVLGEETEVDKTIIEQIADPLVHIIRNAADHGIELPAERQRLGKALPARITLEGRHEGGEVWILISDDGRGLDRAKILAKAKANKLVDAAADNWRDADIYKLVFEPGFSTAEVVTDLSGRGVGMDVVKKNIEKLKGKIDIRSTPGQGSTFILRIPLTLAIIDGMLVRVGQARYTIPILAIRESLQPQPQWITKSPDGMEMVRIRDDFYPVLRLHQRFNQPSDTTNLAEGILVLVESDKQSIALFVDELLGQQETVIKGLSSLLDNAKGFSGCTILGDGQVSLIIDVAGLIEEQPPLGEDILSPGNQSICGKG